MHSCLAQQIQKYAAVTEAIYKRLWNVIRAKIIATSSVETPQHHKTKRCALHCSCVLRGISDLPHIHLYISDHSLCCAQFAYPTYVILTWPNNIKRKYYHGMFIVLYIENTQSTFRPSIPAWIVLT